MKKFYIKDCPENIPTHSWIGNSTNIKKYIDGMKPKNKGTIFKFKDNLLNLNEIKKDSKKVFEKYGWYGMLNVWGEGFIRGKRYGGLSLVHNPSYMDKSIPKNAQTLGYPKKNFPDKIFRNNINLFKRVIEKKLDKEIWNWTSLGTHKLYKLLHSYEIISKDELINLLKLPNNKNIILHKNTYTDSWGFNQWTEPAKFGQLDEICKRIKRSPIRSRLAQIKNIDSEEQRKTSNKFLWHRDDSWFYELRLNLCIDTFEDFFGIEIEDHGKTIFNSGFWYAWNTIKTHRPYIKKIGKTRTNYVLAINPWFDWNNEEKYWFQNEFYGEKHPIDMIIDGDVIKGLELY